MTDENPYQWTTGGKSDLEYVRKIAASSVGTGVYEWFNLPLKIGLQKHFARKVVHIPQQQDGPPILDELQAMERLCTRDHKNIIKVYGYGQLPNSTYQFIDMELCDFNLEEYLLYRRNGKYPSRVPRAYHPVEGGSSHIWDIMRQIANGVAFIHSYKHVHRDLKPQNGVSSLDLINIVLYSIESQAWKIADFGLACEGTESRSNYTQFGHGTPGYRPPELVNVDAGATYTNKVDVWAMGCILFELATGAKPFVTDFAVLEYSKGGTAIETRCHATIPQQMAKKISDTLREILEIKPSDRPKSAALVRLFDEHYHATKGQVQKAQRDEVHQLGETGELGSIEIKNDSSNFNDTGLIEVFVNKSRKDSISFLSAATRRSENLSVFRSIAPHEQLFHIDSKSRSGKQLPERPVIYFSLANSESFRVVTVSGKFSPPYLRNGPILFELWDAHTGALLWEKDGIGHGRDWSHAYPRFSENGKYLVVYDGAWVEILNAYSAQSTGSVNAATIPRPPTALAIGNDGICLALARNDLEERGIGPGVLFEKSFLGGGHSEVDLVSTCGFRNVSLCYISEDRLVMAGNFNADGRSKVIVIFWDTKSGQTLNQVVCGREGCLMGPILPLKSLQVHGRGTSNGVMIPQHDIRVLWQASEDSSDGGESDTLESGYKDIEYIKTFTTYTSEGKWNGRHIVELGKAVAGVVGGKLVILKNRNYLCAWNGFRNTQPRRVGRIDLKTMPNTQQMSSFAISEDRLTLSQTGSPASLIFLSSRAETQS